ncbi:MAG: T9SS type A sorting domain-containing protein [Fidelibacterota bacterium]
MIVNKNSIYLIILSTNYVFTAVTTIDFETANSGYSASDTEGSGWTDVFNRTNYNVSSITEDGYYWAAEDLSLSDPYLTLSQISISGASSFVVQLDMFVKNDSKWDASDEVLLTYSIDGGSYQNLISIQSIASSNTIVAFDIDFDGTGECGTATTLSHRTAGTEDGCTCTNDDFASYTSPVVSLSSNSTLDIKIQFNNLTAGDEGIYIDNIIVTTDPEKCTISGNSGFRMISSPVAGAIYADLLLELWTQSMTGADVTDGSNANVWTLNGYSGTQSFSELTDITTSGASITAGEGFLLYVFSDTDWDGDDDLPVTISVAGKLNNSSATFPSSGSIAASKYGLAGNPYNATIDFDLITLSSNIEVTTSVWDDANTDWKTWNKTSQSGDLSNGLIAPYQGFWVQANSSGTGTITIETGDKSGTGTFYKIADDDNRGSISINATSGNFISESYLSFYSEGTAELDEGDSKKLLPFQASSRITVMSFVDDNAMKIASYPYIYEGSLSIPFDVMRLSLDEANYVTVAEEVTLTWDLEELPDHISMTLTDNITGSETYLDLESEYVFTTEPKGSFSANYDGPIGTYPVVGEPRFTLSVTYGALGQNDDATVPSDFALHPIYPNPFNPSATISFDILDVSLVALNIYDVKGALVETLLQDHMKPGKHHYNWEPQGLSSGVYFMKLTTANQYFTQKVTYIK